MHFFLGTKVNKISGPELTVQCLWCEQQTHAHSWRQTEWLTIFHFLPLFPFRTVFVQCDSCQKEMIATCSLEELGRSNPLTLKYHLVKRVSFVGKVCIALGWLLCWAFLIGLIPAIIGYVYGRKYGGTMKKIAFWGLIANIFSPVIFVFGLWLISHLTK
jgi:hypothetical protein